MSTKKDDPTYHRRPTTRPGERGPHVCAGHKWQSWTHSCPKCWAIWEKRNAGN